MFPMLDSPIPTPVPVMWFMLGMSRACLDTHEHAVRNGMLMAVALARMNPFLFHPQKVA